MKAAKLNGKDMSGICFELDCICSYTRNMDVVMFPVDPRLGTEYMRGARQFVEQIKTSIFVPMHFDEAYDKAAAFLPIAQKNGASTTPMLRSKRARNRFIVLIKNIYNMQVKGRFDHFNINVTDLEKSIKFYETALGLHESHW